MTVETDLQNEGSLTLRRTMPLFSVDVVSQFTNVACLSVHVEDRRKHGRMNLVLTIETVLSFNYYVRKCPFGQTAVIQLYGIVASLRSGFVGMSLSGTKMSTMLTVKFVSYVPNGSIFQQKLY